MRRIFTFLMCVSGLSLAVTWSHAAEPASPDDASVPATASTSDAKPAGDTDEAAQQDAGTERGRSERDRADRRLPMARESLVGSLKERLEELRAKVDDAPNLYKGQALEDVERRLQNQIEQLERAMERIAATDENAARANDARREASPDWDETAARAGRLARDVTERELTRLRELAKELEQSATEETANARTVLERRIDELEHYLADRRERRDADAAGEAGAASPAAEAETRPVARLRHVREAIEHLQAAGLNDQAQGLRHVAAELEAGIMRDRAIQQAAATRERAMQQAAAIHERAAQQAESAASNATRASSDSAAAGDEIRELSQQVGLLRRELRRLRAEVDELRQKHPADEPDSSSPESDRE